MIASQIVRNQGVDPLLDAIALGHAEGLKLFNASPERDSVFELLPDVIDLRHPEARKFASLLIDIKTINGEQTERIKTPVGLIDSLATDLRDRESNAGTARKPTGSQSLAKALRPHLRTLLDRDVSPVLVAAAVREIDRITDGVSRTALTSPALSNQLGRKRFALLQDLIAGVRP